MSFFFDSYLLQEDAMDTKDHRQKLMNKLGSEYSHRCFRQNKPAGAFYPYLYL